MRDEIGREVGQKGRRKKVEELKKFATPTVSNKKICKHRRTTNFGGFDSKCPFCSKKTPLRTSIHTITHILFLSNQTGHHLHPFPLACAADGPTTRKTPAEFLHWHFVPIIISDGSLFTELLYISVKRSKCWTTQKRLILTLFNFFAPGYLHSDPVYIDTHTYRDTC